MSKPRQRRIFLVGYYGVPNVGDEAIRSAIERAAPLHGATIRWYSTRDREDRGHGAVRLRDRRFGQYLLACIRADRVVLGGGGILKDEGMGMPVELFITCLVSRLFRTPVRMLAVGVGPFYSGVGRVLVEAVARMCEVRSVRDTRSAGELSRLGVRDVRVDADPIFSLVPQVRSRSRSAGRLPTAVISVRPWFHMDTEAGPGRRQRLRAAIRTTVKLLLDRGFEVEFVGMHWPRDQVEAAAIVQGMPSPERIRLADAPQTWESLLDICSSAHLVIAMRYHAVAAAAMLGRPTIAVTYEPKVDSLARSLTLPRLPADAEDIEESLPRLTADSLDSPPTTAGAEPQLSSLHAAAGEAIARAMG